MNAVRLVLALLAIVCGQLALAGPQTHIVCPADAPQADCEFRGGPGIQAAVDAAANGDTLFLRAGSYVASAYREVPYKDVIVRGFIVVDGKDLAISGERGAILDGSLGPPTTAIVVRGASLSISGLTLTGFRYEIQEDNYYEGHGLFVIDSRLHASDLTISTFQKMGLIGRGASQLRAERLQIVDGHVGIWLHETAYLTLTESVVSRNDSSAIAAYDDSVAHVARCTFEGNLDDGLFTEHRATIYVNASRITGNRPYGARAVGDSTIWLNDSVLSGNEKDTNGALGRSRVRRAPGP